METKFKTAVALAVLGGLGIVPAASAQPVTAGGKNTQVLYDCVPFDANDEAVVSVTIPQGRRSRMVVVNAYARGTGAAQSCDISTNLDVGTEDVFGGTATGRQGTLDTAVGSWWGDVDRLEAAAPGQFIGVPVPVTLRLFRVGASTCSGVCVSLAVQMVKK